MAVGDAGAGQRVRGGGFVGQDGHELLRKPRFPDPGIADDRDESRASVGARTTVLGSERIEFGAACNQWCQSGASLSRLPTRMSGGGAHTDEDVSTLRA